MSPIGPSAARQIEPELRDHRLHLDRSQWPAGLELPKEWHVDAEHGFLLRVLSGIENEEYDSARTRDPSKPVVPRREYNRTREHVFRFPSAPIHGLQRIDRFHRNDGPSLNMHTYRVYTHANGPNRVDRIYLMHNGLNETVKMGLYHQLAAHLIGEDENTICILRPFPGHMTRYRYQGFAETPLDRYLWDGSNLFSQFLRYMIETKWLLSTLVQCADYRFPSGAELLLNNDPKGRTRLDPEALADAMYEDWMRLYEASKASVPIKRTGGKPQERVEMDVPLASEVFRESIDALQGFLGRPNPRVETLEPQGRSDRHLDPEIHTIGYSLGGFSAQSIFMSWPFAIASCTTLLSGGALRELAPTAFADPEEWQTVLHSLRYEMDDGMMIDRWLTPEAEPIDGEQSSASSYVAGIEPALFRYLQRTFYEVFQQEYRGSFKSRLAAFRRRMLFLVGGNDPIVRPQSVLDSAPPGGINMLSIAGLGHFLDDKASDEEEGHQRNFWIPEIGRLTNEFAQSVFNAQLDEKHGTWLDDDWKFLSDDLNGESYQKPVSRLSAAETLEISGGGALSGELFEKCLDDLLARQLKSDPDQGLLFILRNEIPTVLLDEEAILQHATVLNHDDVGVARYVRGVQERKVAISADPTRNCIVLPWNARVTSETIDRNSGFPSQGESAAGQGLKSRPPAEAWRAAERGIRRFAANDAEVETARVFDGRDDLKTLRVGNPDLEVLLETFEKLKKQPLEMIPSLPDCWLWISQNFVRDPSSAQTQKPDDEPSPLNVDQVRSPLCVAVSNYSSSSEKLKDWSWENALRNEDIRIVTVSRARYNPRFRGRVLTDPKAVELLMLHATLCISASKPISEEFEFAEPA